MKRPLATVILLAILLAPLLLSAQDNVKCAACGKLIENGTWIQAEGKYYHPNHFVCDLCKKPLGTRRYWLNDGHRYDSACYVNLILPKCAYCGLPIRDTVTTYHDKPYHQNCYADHVALKCSVCGQIINGEYMKDRWGNIFHKYHENEPRCRYCGRLLTAASDGARTYSDGRTICGLCFKTAILSLDEAVSIMNDVKAQLAAEGIVIERDKLPLQLIDSRRMVSVRSHEIDTGDMQGYTWFRKETLLYGLIAKRQFNIYVLRGMPRTEFIAIIAHELMHVWLGLNAPMYQDKQMVEGSCQYAASLILKRLGTDEAGMRLLQMLDSKDRIYGDGYRKVLAQIQSRGLPDWLNYLKHNSAAPW